MLLTTDVREQQKLELATSLLRSGNTIRIKARGASMLPTIWPGDLLEIESAACRGVTPGDVALVVRDGRSVVHRVVDRSGHAWITRGDAMPQSDPPVGESDVVGRVSGIRRRGRVIVPSRRLSLLRRVVGWVLCHSDRARNLALKIYEGRRERAISRIPRIADIPPRG